MKKSIILFITLVVCSIYTSAQQQNDNNRGIYESYVIISKNGGGPTYYDLQTDQAANPNFGGSLGIFGTGCSLVINGGQNNTYKCNGCNISNGSFNYAIYPSGGSASSFSSFVLGFASNDAGGCGGNQTWRNNSQNINVLNGLNPGTYVIEIYTQNPFDGCGSGILFSSNNGSNYKATFTVIGPPTLPASASVCLGSSVSLTGSCTNGTPKWSTGEEANTISVSPTATTTYTATCKTAEGCESATSSSVTVTVNSVSIVAQPATQYDCEPNSVRFLANATTTSTGAGSTITYLWERKLPSESNFTALTSVSPTLFSGNSLQVSPSGTPNTSGTQFRYVATDGNGCSVTSNPATLYLNNVGTISNTAICENTNYSLTVPVASDVLANVVSYQWEVLDASTNTWGNVSNGGGISGATAQTLSFTAIPFSQDGKKYRCRVIFNVSANNDNDGSINQGPATTCPRTSAEVTLNVKPIPTVPTIVTASPQNLCLEASVTLNSTGCSAQGGTTSWYESGVVVSTNAIYTFTPSAVSSKTYRATCTKSACESGFSTDIVVNVNPVPVAPPVSINPASAVVCQGATVVLTATKETASNTLRWYKQAVGGSSVSIAVNRTVPVGEVIPADPNTPGVVSYWTEQENSFGCKSLRTQTDFTVNPTPSAPTVATPINYCQNASTSTLIATATGSNTLLWYGTSSSGGVSSASAPLPSSTSLGTTTYYVSQRNSYTCESTRAAINVIINAIPPSPSTTTTISYCKNSPSTALSATATGSNSLVWYDENDNILASAPTPNTATVGTQIFKVSQKSQPPANCESPKVTITVTIHDLPSAPTVATPVNYCQNATATALTATATGSNALLWYGTNSVGGISSGIAPTPATNIVGITSYFVSQKDANNCESTRAKIDVEVTANTTVSISGTNAFCMTGALNTATSLTANPAGGNGTYSYQWQNLSGVIASATNQTYEVNNAVQSGSSDTYKVTVNSGNCTATANITVTKQGWSDIPSVSGNTPDICGSGSKTLSVVSPFGTNYKWYSDATSLSPITTGTSFTTQNLTTTTTYYVAREQQITTNLTCQTVRTAVTINVSAIPETPIIINSANKTIFCNNESGFTLSTTCTTGNPQYRLNNGSWTNGGSLPIVPLDYTTLVTLKYDFKCVLNATCESSIASTTLTINPVPSVPTITGNTTICEGSSTTLTANGCGGTIVWSEGSTGSVLMVSKSGTYSALCRLNGCESQSSAVATVVANPIPSAPTITSDDSDNTVCAGTTIKLTANGCSGTIVWSNGATGSVLTLSSSGTYAALCRVDGCESLLSSVETILVNPIPSAPTIVSDDADNMVCAGTAVKLTANGCVGTVVWSNGVTATTITISSSGTYNATCTVNACTSAASSTQTIVVNQNPTITLGSISSICNAATSFDLPYTATSNNPDKYSLTSTMPDFVSVSDASLLTSPVNILIPSGKTGSHTFTLDIKNSLTNCTNSQTFSINILSVLLGGSIETSSSTVNCSGYNAGVISSVSAASGGKTAYVYQWQSSTDGTNFTDISSENLTTYNPPAITQTTYYRRKVTDACGVVAYSSNVHQIQIVPDPQITITDVTDRTICSGGVLNLEATVIGGSGTCTATWESSATQTGTYSVEQTGGLSFSKTLTNVSSTQLVRYYRVSYSCAGTGSGACNQSVSGAVKVAVNYIPNAPTVSGNSSICAGSSTSLTASGCAGTVTWNNASTGSSLSVSASGTYTATCTENSCTSLASNIHTITVNPIPNAPTVASDDADNIVCAGTSIKLSVSDCAGTVVWSNNTSATSISVSTSGTYNAVCIVNGCSSVASITQTLVVNAIPSSPIISGNTSICSGNSTTLTASGCSGTVVWNTGVTSSTLSVSSAGTYNATCTLNDCVSAVSQTQTVSVNSVPTAPTISGNTSFCVGSATTLTANGCAGVITWSTGATGNTLNVSTVGTYSATCTENSCTSPASLVQNISSNLLPTISLGTISSLCNAATIFDLPFTSTTNSPDKYSLTSTMPDFVAVAETNLLASPITVAIPSGKTGNQNFSLTIKNSTTGCISTQTFNINILPALIGGSIETSSSTINCSGYNAGAISSVSLASGGKTDYLYQWQSSTDGMDFTDISGANLTTYDPPALTQTTYYRRKVSDACGAEAFSSNVHQIQIVPDPQITITDVTDRTVCSGGNISIDATVIGGSGTCTPTWQSSTTPSGTYTNEQVGGLNFSTTLTNITTAAIIKYYRAIYSCAGTGSGSCNQGTSAVVKVIINPNPNVLTVSGGGTICSGNSTTLTASSCNGSVVWSNGATATSISVSSPDTYSAVCTNSCGTSAASNEVVVNVTTITPPTLSGATTVCSGQSATLTASGCAGTVVWSNSSSGTSITVSPSTTTSYTAVCNASGCTSLSSESVTVTVAPSIDFTVGTVADLCNSATSFSLPYSLVLGSPDKYSLTSTMAGFASVTDGNLAASPITVTIPSGQTGTFSFTLTLKISSTGCSKSQTFAVTILPALIGGSIETSSSTINCSGYNAGAISSVSLASGGKLDYLYQWQSSTDGMNFTDISGANLTTYDPPALTQTTYYRRKVSDACGAEAFSSNVHQIQIVPDPQITITDVTDRTICSGGNISIDATVIGGSGTCTPTWQSSTTPSGTYTNEQVGGLNFSTTLTNSTTAAITKYYRAIYSCAGTGSGSCNQGTSAVVKVTVNPNPSVLTVSGGGTICSGNSTTLTASSCNGSVVWSNGVTATSITVSLAGTYSAVCTNNCGTSVTSNEVVVNVTTIAPLTVSGATTVCSGQSATLTASSCAGTVVWSNSSSGTSITVSPSTTASYTAVCNASGCTSLNSESVTVTVAPSIDFTVGTVADLCNSATSFSVPYSLVLGSPDKYSLTSTMAGFASVTDGNLTASPITVTIPSSQTGTFSFTLTLKISSTGCSKSQTFAVTILPALIGGSIEISSNTINCSGYNAGAISSVSLASGGKTDYVYQWQSSTDGMNFTDISGANLTTYDPPALTQTTYYRRKVSDACGAEAFSSNLHQIQIVPDPQITITDVTDRTICSGGNISIDATVIGGSGTCTPTWQSSTTPSGTYTNEQVGGLNFTTNLTNSTTAAITKYYRAIYSCAGTGSGSCNQGTSAVVKVTVNPIPNVPTITPASVVICPTQSTTLTASGCNGLVMWNGGQTGSTLSVSEAGTYAATCTLNNCVSALSSSATVTVASGGTPVAPPVISGTATICNGQSTNLTATNCTGVVSWSNGMSGTLISVNPSTSTDYTATCFDGTCTSNSSNKITVTVNLYPTITTHPKNEADCDGNSVTFSVTASSVSSYQWQRKMPNGTFTDIANAISNTLTISNVGSSTDPNQTEYRVVLSNGTCSVTSTAAILTVNSVVGSLADQTICDGANASFNLNNVVVSGNIQSYQWQRRVGTSGTWNDIAGATTTTLTINAATNTDEQYYRCKVTFTAGSSTCARYTTEDDSNGAKLGVLVASTPSISGTNAVCLGKSTTLTANNCDGAIAWSSGQTTASITVSPTSNTSSYTVTCTSTQCGFNVSSTPYLVTVNNTPQPEIITYDVITPATLTFAARTTVPNATLMWYNRASGGTGTTTAPSFTVVGTYSYWVTQTDPITGCESARLPIIAKVLDFFRITQQPTNQVDCKGNSVFFGVVAVGPNPAFTYQWQRKRPNEPDFVNLVEEGNGIRGWYARTMSVSNVGDANNPNQTQYRCIISSGGQVLTSEISTLTVNSLTGSMPNLGICVGGDNEFNLQNYFTISGNVLSYQWQTRPGTSGAWTDLSDGNGISGSTSSALKFTKATYEQGVYYRCLVKFNTQGFECTEPTDAAKLIVSGFPPAPFVSNVFYCQNSSAVRLKVDSPIQNLVWYSQETGGVGVTTPPTPSTGAAGIFKYYVADRTDEGCESSRAIINVEVGALPPAPKNTTLTPINEGNILTLSAEGTPAENQVLRWYTSPTITTFSTTAPSFTAAGTYSRYVAQVSAFGCVGPRTAITATIIPSLKFTKQPLSQADCDGNSVTFSVTATAPNTFTYQWQRQKPTETSFNDILNENSATLKISNIGSTTDPHLTKYRCIIKDDKSTTVSEEALLTVNAIVGTLPTMSLCDGKASKLSFGGLTITGTVAEYQWQKKQGNSYIDIPTNIAGVAIINEIGTYRGKITFVVDKNTTCSRTTDDLKVEVKPTPIAPQVTNQNACLDTPFDITKAVTASNSLLWYESATDTTSDKTLPKIDVSKVGKTTFFVSQITSFGCESERKSFDVAVAVIPEKPITTDLTYCRNAPSLALTASTSPQNQVVWYASLTAKDAFTQTPTPNTKLDGETVYFAAAKSTAGCESERVPLKVSVAPCIANFTNNFNNCLQVSADSVKGNQWFDLYDAAGRLYASVNPNGLNLGKVSISIRHYGRGSAAIPTTKNDTRLMARYVDFQSSILNEFPTLVSLRIYYLNEELNEYKTATNLPNLTINDFNIVHYDGVREDCGFENNDNFTEGDSYVIYKNVIGNQLAKDFFYLQFDVNDFSENGATANDFTEITFSGKETEAQTVQLNWQSKFEVKAEKYIIERSADCKNFVPIAEVKANGIASVYENTDFQPFAGKNCYRLVYMDKDGTKKFSDNFEVNFTDQTPICSVFPNPWNKGDEIKLYLRNINEKEIKLYDMLGQTYSFDMNKEASKIIKIRPDVHLSKGVHFLVIVGEDGKKCVQKIVINP